jgi:hypothetical protein
VRFTLTIDCDNAAFEDHPGSEVARILKEVARKLPADDLGSGFKLRDVNGNTVGKVEVSERS